MTSDHLLQHCPLCVARRHPSDREVLWQSGGTYEASIICESDRHSHLIVDNDGEGRVTFFKLVTFTS